MEKNSNQIFNYDDISLKILMELEKIKNGLKIDDNGTIQGTGTIELNNGSISAENCGSISGTGKIDLQDGKISFVPNNGLGGMYNIKLDGGNNDKPKMSEEDKKIMEEQIQKAKEEEDKRFDSYGEKFMKEAQKFKIEVINNYLFLVGPIYAKIVSLRNSELFRIFRSDEFIKFKDSLPKNQKISIDGYIIHRKETPITTTSLPGFEETVNYEYEYDQLPEDITFLFGSEEYIKKIKELKNSILSFKEYIKMYYELPYESPYTQLDFIDPYSKFNKFEGEEIKDPFEPR